MLVVVIHIHINAYIIKSRELLETRFCIKESRKGEVNAVTKSLSIPSQLQHIEKLHHYILSLKGKNLNLIKNRPTKTPIVFNLGVVERAEERQSSPIRHRREFEAECFKLALPFRFEGRLHHSLGRKRLHHHRPMASVLAVANRELEAVGLVRDGPDHLSNGALSPCDELHSRLARGDVEMGRVYELNGLERLDDPPWEGRGRVLLLGREEDAVGGVEQDVRALLESAVPHQVT